MSSSPVYRYPDILNIWGFLSFLTDTVTYEGMITKQNVCFVMFFIVKFLIVRRSSGSSVYRGIMVLGSPENHWRFCCPVMNNSYLSCVDPDGIDYFVLDHSRRTSDLCHCGDYVNCSNAIDVHRPSGNEAWSESFSRDSLNL